MASSPTAEASSAGLKSSGMLADLYSLKMKKLEEQKLLSDKMNELVGQQTSSSNQCRKNLKAAIAVSKKPGCKFFCFVDLFTK